MIFLDYVDKFINSLSIPAFVALYLATAVLSAWLIPKVLRSFEPEVGD